MIPLSCYHCCANLGFVVKHAGAAKVIFLRLNNGGTDGG